MDDNNANNINVCDDIIVKCNKIASIEKLDGLQSLLVKMRNDWVIVLPKYCSVIAVPKDMQLNF